MSKKSYKDYISKPTLPRILANMSANLDKFIGVMRELSDPASELAKNSPPSALLSKNFKSHPNVHVGYYDERRNSVLYVCDVLNQDALIQKKDAVLLCDGTFTKISDNTLYDSSFVSTHVGGALAGSEVEKKWCLGKYFYVDLIGLFVPVVLEDYVKAISINHLSDSLYNSYRAYCEGTGRQHRPESRDMFSPEDFLGWYNQTVLSPQASNAVSRSFK